MADLPDAFRTVFVLREIEGLTVEDTAEASGHSRGHGEDPAAARPPQLQEALAPDVQRR